MSKVGHFDICKAMAVANQDIRMSPLDNVLKLDYRPKRRGTDVTIGVDGDLVAAIGLENKYLGGLFLINRDQYLAMKEKLESEAAAGSPMRMEPQPIVSASSHRSDENHDPEPEK